MGGARRAARVAVAVLAVVLALPAPASADLHAWPSPDGMCDLVAVEDTPGHFTGQVKAGPVTPPAPYETHAASVTCSVQVGEWSHDGADAAVATGPATPGGAVLPPAPVAYSVPADEFTYLCTRLDVVGGPTLYRAGIGDPLIDDMWVTNPADACVLVMAAEAPAGDPVAYCHYDTSSGTATYAPPLQLAPAPVTFRVTLSIDCAGSAPLAGHYDLTFTGSGDIGCATGSGTALLSGTGPNGAVSGSASFDHAGLSYLTAVPGAGTSTFTDATGTHPMWWALGHQEFACPAGTADLRGHGVLGT